MKSRDIRNIRKRQLIVQGAIHRTEVMLARQAVRDSLQPDALAKRTLHRTGLAALAAFRNRNALGVAGLDLRTILPLAMTGISLLVRKKSLVRPLVRGVVVSGVIAGIVALWTRRETAADGDAGASE